MTRGPRTERGSVLLEGILTITLVSAMTLLNLELVRRSRYEVLLQHGAFLLARGRALGVSQRQAEARALEFFEAALGRPAARRFWRRLELSYQLDGTGATAKIKIRYPMFVRQQLKDQSKHHLESTHECKFPFS